MQTFPDFSIVQILTKINRTHIPNLLEKLIQILQERESEIVTLEMEVSQTEHPWMKFAGMHKDNPLFAEVLEYIEAERSQIDLENETE